MSIKLRGSHLCIDKKQKTCLRQRHCEKRTARKLFRILFFFQLTILISPLSNHLIFLELHPPISACPAGSNTYASPVIRQSLPHVDQTSASRSAPASASFPPTVCFFLPLFFLFLRLTLYYPLCAPFLLFPLSPSLPFLSD